MEPSSPSQAERSAPERCELLLAVTTESSQERAEAMARALLELQLVACVSLRPVRSLYPWQGRIEDCHEVELLLKTSPSCLVELRAHVHRLHSYESPQWFSWRAVATESYAGWVWAATSSRSDP